MANKNLTKAKNAKNDEFYTQYADIEKEINAYVEYNPTVFKNKTILLPCDDPEWSNFTKFFAQNFAKFGLKKLISTSYAPDSKAYKTNYAPTLFEEEAPQYNRAKTTSHGKIFTLTKDRTGDGKIDTEDLEWDYLDGDGDFNSPEVKALRNEADIIITNPPFSLFRDFLAWVMEADKKVVLIGNKNAITYKEVFPIIKENKFWVGATSFNKDMLFITPNEIDPSDYPKSATRTVKGITYLRSPSVWFSNIDHGRRHEPLQLMTKEDNFKYNSRFMKKMNGKTDYEQYDNYDAIEVPFTNAIPLDHKGMMGVPISFLDKYNPEQFEIVGMCENEDLYKLKAKVYTTAECKAAYLAKFGKKGVYDLNASGVVDRDGLLIKVYQRILLKHKKKTKNK